MNTETPMRTTLCPLCRRMCNLKTWALAGVEYTPTLKPGTIEAVYNCEGGHEIRMEITRSPSFTPGSAA